MFLDPLKHCSHIIRCRVLEKGLNAFDASVAANNERAKFEKNREAVKAGTPSFRSTSPTCKRPAGCQFCSGIAGN